MIYLFLFASGSNVGFALLLASLTMLGSKAKRSAPPGIRQGCRNAAKKLKAESDASKFPSQLAMWMVLHRGSVFE